MEIDTEQLLKNAIQNGIREGIQRKLGDYNSPLDKMLAGAIAQHEAELRGLLADALAECVGNPDFRASVKDAVRATLAKTLVQRFGGELEKQVNVLKSDPSTRARITLAIEQIVGAKV